MSSPNIADCCLPHDDFRKWALTAAMYCHGKPLVNGFGEWVPSTSSQTTLVTSKVQILRAISINTGNLPEDGTLNSAVPPSLGCLVPHQWEVCSPCLHPVLRALHDSGHFESSMAPLLEPLSAALQHFSLLISFRGHLYLWEIVTLPVSTWPSLLH